MGEEVRIESAGEVLLIFLAVLVVDVIVLVLRYGPLRVVLHSGRYIGTRYSPEPLLPLRRERIRMEEND